MVPELAVLCATEVHERIRHRTTGKTSRLTAIDCAIRPVPRRSECACLSCDVISRFSRFECAESTFNLAAKDWLVRENDFRFKIRFGLPSSCSLAFTPLHSAFSSPKLNRAKSLLGKGSTACHLFNVCPYSGTDTARAIRKDSHNYSLLLRIRLVEWSAAK